MTNLTITQLIKLPVEELQAMEIAQLEELHTIAKESKQKPAKRRADLISGIIAGKKKEAKKEEKELELVENSAKLKAPKKKAKAEKKEPQKKAKKEEKEEEQKEEVKAEEKPKKKSLKRPKKEQPNVKQMSKEELEKLAATLLEENQKFPSVISGQKVQYKRQDFETIEEIQTVLQTKPFTLFMTVDERIDNDLTFFQVLYASEDVIVMLDKTRQVNSTINLDTSKGLEAEHIVFEKKKYEYSFYIKEAR